MWDTVKKHLTKGKALYFSHGFGITYKDQTNIIPPEDIDVILVAPKGSGTSLRRLFLEGKGLNSSFAIHQDVSGNAREKAIALGIGVGDKIIMLENSWYSVISPENCSTILWGSWDYKEQAAESLKLTAQNKITSASVPAAFLDSSKLSPTKSAIS